jgi:putative aminopeptidase FrvX
MILKQLSEAFGVSGNEDEVRQIVLNAVREHVDEIRVDAMGNVLALKKGKGRLRSPRDGDRRMRVLLAAHMDEVGLMVVDHEKSGHLRVRPVGGVDARLLPGSLLKIGPERKPGVIGIKPIHLLEEGEEEKVTKMEELAVDIGAKTKEEAQKLAPLGTYVTFATEFRELGPTVMGKAFDDRVGCTVLIELLRGEPFRFDLHAAFTVQEEVGLRGAAVAAYAIDPDCAVALEGTVADDLPKDKDVSPTTELGKGPAVTIMDRSFIADRGLVRLITSTAEELGIPYQIKQPGIGGTDSGAIYQSRAGVPSVTVAVPCRYIHSPAAILDLEDLRNTVRLVRESLSRLKTATLSTEQHQ